MKWDNNEITIPTADVKEGLHMLPWGYTAAAGDTEKTRHRMIGNGWHIGTAMFLLLTLLAEPTEAKKHDNPQETVWHRQGSTHTSRSPPVSETPPRIWTPDKDDETSDEHGRPMRHWKEYCEIKRSPIVEHRSGSAQALASESKTALRSMGVKDSPTLGDDGDLCVRGKLCPSSLTADPGVYSSASEGSL